MKVSKPTLSTPQKYRPASDSWSVLTFTVSLFPSSRRLNLPDSAVCPEFTVITRSTSPRHGSLHKYLLLAQAQLWEQRKETRPLSIPWTWRVAPSVGKT